MEFRKLLCPGDLGGGENTLRLTRMFARFISVGYLAYLAILLPSINMLAPRMDSWWTPVTVALVFGSGLLPGALSFRSDPTPMRVTSGVAAALFLVAAASWPLAWNGPDIGDDDGVWLAFFPGVASIAAVIVWPTVYVFGHLVIGCVAVQVINFVARGETDVGLLAPEIMFAIMFCTLFVGGGVMAMRTGRLLDSTTETTYAAAAVAAAGHARTVERERFDALIHDSVLSTFLIASRGQPKEVVGAMATTALAELDNIRAEAVPDQQFSATEAINHLRAASVEADDTAMFRVLQERDHKTADIPADVIRTMGSALSEALRNSRLHAGPNTTRTVDANLTETGLGVVVADDGAGFDPASVAPHRLGIAVSIVGRLSNLPGGSAHVDTRPGSGTRVYLGWEAR
ncbi:sensor histidine kinase [Williamsia sp.]|uniref:sensor histidine kinase n=1 Tax=Williamsia sp. TaxID=1872085 RepID=UPI002F931F7F